MIGRAITKGIVIFARWLDYQLAGEQPPKACEYRRAASITHYRHGERKRARPAA